MGVTDEEMEELAALQGELRQLQTSQQAARQASSPEPLAEDEKSALLQRIQSLENQQEQLAQVLHQALLCQRIDRDH